MAQDAALVQAGRQVSKGDRTRRRLLDAAASEVARHGVAGTSINAIAAAADLKAGSIYFHFESKDRLVEAMFVEGLQASLVILDEALTSSPPNASAAARLGSAIRAHARAVHELADYALAVLGPSFPRDAVGAAAWKLRRSYVSRWRSLILEAQAEGVLPRDTDPRLLRDLILGALNAVALAGQPAEQAAVALEAMLRIGSRDRNPARLAR